MKVALRFDASHKIGLGHLYRCVTLAEELQKRGHEPVFVTKIYPETVEALMSCGIDVAALKPDAGKEEELQVLADTSADAIIVDMMQEHASYINDEYMQKLKSKSEGSIAKRRSGPFLLALDNNGEGAYAADKTVNVLHNKIHGENIIEDFSYAILRKMFQKEHGKDRVLNEKIREILVMQGGTDRYNTIPKILKALEGEEYHVTVAAGVTYKQPLQENNKLKVLRNIQDMAALMSEADMAITGAGVSLLEFLCVGTPTITISTEDFEKITAEKLDMEEATVNAGFGPDVNGDTIKNMVKQMEDLEKRRALSEKGKKLIDGKGTERVADLIEEGANEA